MEFPVYRHSVSSEADDVSNDIDAVTSKLVHVHAVRFKVTFPAP